MQAPTDRQVILSLVEDKMLRRVINMIVKAVEQSFLTHPCRRTQAEEKRRAARCFSIWKDLRAEARYPLSRIEDCLAIYLGYDLDGIEWSPLKRRSWLPGDPVSRTLPKSDPDARLLIRR